MIVGALLGTGTHVLLDSLMHADLHPFSPWSQANPLLLAVPIDDLHLGCVGAGVFGLALLVLRRMVAFAQAVLRQRKVLR